MSKLFQIGHLIYLDFNSAILQVIDLANSEITCRVVQGGKVGSNKAVNLNHNFPLKPITKKDIESIKLSKKYGIKHFALSFAQNEEDVNQFRNLVGNNSLISKIESNKGLQNLNGIIDTSDAILLIEVIYLGNSQ